MRKLGIYPLTALFFTWLCAPAAAQQAPTDSTPDLRYAIGQYERYLFPEKGVFTGRQYLDYQKVLYEGHHPFFKSAEFQDAAVMYDGILYVNQPVQYDTYKNVLVTWDPQHKYLIQLVNEKVDWFTINDARFVHVRADAARNGLADGFYHLLYDGRIKVLKLEQKRVVQEIDIKKVLRKIEETTHYFILTNNRYFEITGKSSLLRALKDKQGEINQFIRKNNLDIQSNKDNALAVVAAQYDQLTQ